MSRLIYKSVLVVGTAISVFVAVSCEKDNDEASVAVNHPELVGTMVEVPAGKFIRGSVAGITSLETPNDTIVITKPFMLGATEVTNTEFCDFLNQTGVASTGFFETEQAGSRQLLCASDTSRAGRFNQGIKHDGAQWVPIAGYEYYPAIYISWYGAYEYCKWKGGRLPTESEWEYASGGAKLNLDKYAGTNDFKELNTYAWTNSNSEGQSKPVGNKKPNELGLYDIMGNVNEWCNDWFDPKYYTNSRENQWLTDPQGPDSLSVASYWTFYYPYKRGSRKIFRGGSYVEPTTSGTEGTHRVAYRGHMLPTMMWNSYGFRMAKDND